MSTLPVKVTIESLTRQEQREEIIRSGQFQVLVNQDPAPGWLQDHPMVSGVKYLPISRVEWLLTTLFLRWNLEIKSIMTIANSVVVTVRLYYLDPITGQMEWQDGAGSCPIQTDKGAGAMEWDKVQSMSVMKAVPAAESYAEKDAAEKIGKIFGRDLNRKNGGDYSALVSRVEKEQTFTQRKVSERVMALIQDSRTVKDLEAISKEVPDDLMDFYTVKMDELKANEKGAKK